MRVFSRSPLNLDNAFIPSGFVYLIPERCKGCRFCIRFCPQQILIESTKTNQKGYYFPEIITGKENGCINCEFCSLVCPEFAIFTSEAQ